MLRDETGLNTTRVAPPFLRQHGAPAVLTARREKAIFARACLCSSATCSGISHCPWFRSWLYQNVVPPDAAPALGLGTLFAALLSSGPALLPGSSRAASSAACASASTSAADLVEEAAERASWSW